MLWQRILSLYEIANVAIVVLENRKKRGCVYKEGALGRILEAIYTEPLPIDRETRINWLTTKIEQEETKS
jgi:hypothetical protein